MTIGTTDPMLALVRGQLERIARSKGGRPAAAANRATGPGRAARGRLQAIAGLADLPEEAFRRALVGALLTDEFGEEVATDPRFQSVIDRATRMMTDDPGLAGVLADVRRGLLAGQ